MWTDFLLFTWSYHEFKKTKKSAYRFFYQIWNYNLFLKKMTFYYFSDIFKPFYKTFADEELPNPQKNIFAFSIYLK